MNAIVERFQRHKMKSQINLGEPSLGTVVKKVPLPTSDEMGNIIGYIDDETIAVSCAILDVKEFETVGNHFLEVLLKVKHNYAIDKKGLGSLHCAIVCFVQMTQDGALFDASQYSFSGKDIVDELELGGFEDEVDGLHEIGGGFGGNEELHGYNLFDKDQVKGFAWTMELDMCLDHESVYCSFFSSPS